VAATGISVRHATADDAVRLAPKLRRADLQEIQAATGETALGALERGLQDSDPSYVIIDAEGTPLALFGVVPDIGDKGIVWLLGSDAIEEHAISFARGSRPWLDRLHERYPVLWSFVDVRNELHLRWLTWCGFEVTRTIEGFGVERRAFHEVVRVRARIPDLEADLV